MKKIMSRAANGGFTLIEMLISISLSLIILASVLSAYFYGAQATKHMEKRLKVQQNARFALISIAKDLRMAGSFGCAIPNSGSANFEFHNDVTNSEKWLNFVDETTGISQQNLNNAWLSSSASGFVPNNGSKALVIQYGTNITDASFDSTTDTIKTVLPDNQTDITNAAVLALANCQHLYLFDKPVFSASSTANEFSFSPKPKYLTATDPALGWQLMRLITVAYSVGKYKGKQGLYLFELDSNGVWSGPKNIAADVTDFNVEFGTQDCSPGVSDATPTTFFDGKSSTVAAWKAIDWHKVSFVRLTLNMVTNDANLGDANNKINKTYNSTTIVRRGNLCINQANKIS